MWFQKEKLVALARNDRVTVAWLIRRLGCTGKTLRSIMHGQQAADYGTAKGLLEVFGYDAVVEAIDWRRTQYAG